MILKFGVLNAIKPSLLDFSIISLIIVDSDAPWDPHFRRALVLGKSTFSTALIEITKF